MATNGSWRCDGRTGRAIAALGIALLLALDTRASATEIADAVFIIDGSGSIGAATFELQKEGIKTCIAEFPADGSLAVGVIQFSAFAVLYVPLTVIDSPATAQQVIATIDGMEQLGGGTTLGSALETAFILFNGDAAGPSRALFISTDGGVSDEADALVRCEALRTMVVPVTICTALVGVNCPQTDPFLENCANTTESRTYDPRQPAGRFVCADAIDGFEFLCTECLCALAHAGEGDCDGDGLPDACEIDCNLNGTPDECEDLVPTCVTSDMAKITASDAAADDQFGKAVAVSGNVAIVGSKLDDDTPNNSGSAYVYRFDGATWNEVAKLTAPDAAGGDQFGDAVAVSGRTAVVGAFGNSDAGVRTGSAYVFEEVGGSWGLVKKLLASDAAAGDEFGRAVAVSGNVIVIGAPLDDDAEISSGAAYVFMRSAGGADNWGEVAKLTAPGGSAGDQFGDSLDVSGNVALIGAAGNAAAGSLSARAYVFERDEGGPDAWGFVTQLLAPVIAVDDRFGTTVSLSGDVAVIGATTALPCSGIAHVFRFDGVSWLSEAALQAPDTVASDEFGLSVSVSGNVAVIGAHDDSDDGLSSGSAYAFLYDGLDWSEPVKITAGDADAGDEFGAWVSASCDTVLVGAFGNDDAGSRSGSAYAAPGFADCNANGQADVCDIASGESEDLDGDGRPDDCLPGCACSRIRIAQESAPGAADFDDNVLGCLLPHPGAVPPADLYAYRGSSYDGATIQTVPDRTNLFLADTTDGLSLVIVHDSAVPLDPGGGQAEMRFELFGDGDGAYRSVEDDPDPKKAGGTYTGNPGDSLFTSKQLWSICCTDGLVLSDLEGPWRLFVQFDDVDGDSGTPAIAGLDEWVAHSADGSLIYLDLVVGRRVRIDVIPLTECAEDLDGSGDVGFADLLAVLSLWGPCVACPEDLDASGDVGFGDLLLILSNWGPCPE